MSFIFLFKQKYKQRKVNKILIFNYIKFCSYGAISELCAYLWVMNSWDNIVKRFNFLWKKILKHFKVDKENIWTIEIPKHISSLLGWKFFESVYFILLFKVALRNFEYLNVYIFYMLEVLLYLKRKETKRLFDTLNYHFPLMILKLFLSFVNKNKLL